MSLGIGDGRLRGSDLVRPFHGVVAIPSRAGVEAYLPALRPGDRFSHTTAARIWGVPLPQGCADDLHVTATRPRNPPRGAGVIGHVGLRDDAVLRRGIPVSTPAALFRELATLLDLDDLIAVGDALVFDPPLLDPADLRPWIAIDELRAASDAFRGRSARRVREACGLVRVGAASRPETLLRLLLMHAGLPEPRLNYEIRDAQGRFIGYFDLVFPEYRVIVEYDGDQHRSDTRQYEHDIARFERSRAAGWTDVRIRARGLFVTQELTVDRVRAALGSLPASSKFPKSFE